MHRSFSATTFSVSVLAVSFFALDSLAAPSSPSAPAPAAAAPSSVAALPAPSPQTCAARKDAVTAALSVLLAQQSFDDAQEVLVVTSPLLSECSAASSGAAATSRGAPASGPAVNNFARQLVNLASGPGSIDSAFSDLAAAAASFASAKPGPALDCDAARREKVRLESERDTKQREKEGLESTKASRQSLLRTAFAEFYSRCGAQYPARSCPNIKIGDTSAEAQMQAIYEDIQNLTMLIKGITIDIARLTAQIKGLDQSILDATRSMNQACSQ